MTPSVSQPHEKRAETTRMFESDFFEWFSRIHPATPFVTWIPVLAYVAYRCFARGGVGALSAVGLVVGGYLIWTITEYVLHRYVFHWTKDTPFGRRVHFLVHGVHHDFPSDKDRLVMPLGVSIPVGTAVYFLLTAAFGLHFGEPLYIGFGIGYLSYDGTHYYVHHFRQTTRIGKFLKKHHMTHHHADHDGGFGVSTPLWDFVFRTMPSAKAGAKRATKKAAASA
jgi:sterol desaturase/sphingolipid hydroxylase (fatty acid hydroxylase superfamily)